MKSDYLIMTLFLATIVFLCVGYIFYKYKASLDFKIKELIVHNNLYNNDISAEVGYLVTDEQILIRFKKNADLFTDKASLLISLGENALVIRDRLGHEDPKTTLGTYGHLYPNMNREVANKLNNILKFDNKSVVEQRPKVSNQFMNARKYKSGIIEDEQ